MQELLRAGSVEVRGRDQRDAGVDALLNGLALQMIDESLHAELSHAKWVLHNDPLQLSGAHGLHEDVAGVEADELDLARFAGVLQRQQRAGGR